MILSFDKFERYEIPQVTLCNPNSRATEVDGKITITDTVGVLSNPKGMNLKLNFNAPHELSFDYYRHKSSDPIKQSFYDSIYEAIQTDRYIYLADIGYFVISNVTDSDEDNIDKKSISLKSCEENELATAEGLYLEEGTYYLHTEDNKGLLDLFLPKTVGWTIGFIDPSLLTKPYFVEETEVDNGYNFLYTTIQDMFECIAEPDIIRRTISVYSRAYYAEHHLTDIHIAKYNLLKHKTVEENDEDKYTALNVQGKDENLEIRTVNPTGKNVIYNFEPRYSWMSSALQEAVEKWQEKCESVEDEYFNLQKDYYNELDLLFNEKQDIEVKKGELKQLEETRDLIVSGQYNAEQNSIKVSSLEEVNSLISEKQEEINDATSNYNVHRMSVQTAYEEPINKINADCTLSTSIENFVMESGTISSSNGQPSKNKKRIRTANYTILDSGTYTISNSQNFPVVLYVYDNNNNWLSDLSISTWSDLPLTFSLDSQYKIKFAIKKSDTDEITMSNVTGIKLEKNTGSFAVDINGNTIFTTNLLNELMTHIKPTDYVDEYMVVTESMTYPRRFEKAKELMDRAQSQLVKISSGQKTYSIDTRSFLFNKQFKRFSEQLGAGAIIYVETKNDIMEQLHLTVIDINFDEKSTNFTLGNKYDRSDLKALYEDALGQNSKSFSELKYIASIIEDQQKQLDYQRNWVADLRTLTLDNVLTSEDQAIEINNHGLVGRKRQLDENGEWAFDENGNPLFDPEQVKLINNTLVFTDKNWQNATTAVGKIAVGYNSDGSVKYAYGINGQVLIGELILGTNLILSGTGAGIKIKNNNNNDVFYADENGNLVLSGTIFANSGRIGNWYIEDYGLYWANKDADGKLISSCFFGGGGANTYLSIQIPKSDGSGTDNPLYINKQGLLFCNNATFSFPTLNSPILNNVTINSGSFTGTIAGMTAGVTGLDGSYTYNNKNGTLFLGCGGNRTLLSVVYDNNNPFYVDKSGILWATDANISGKIIANTDSVFNGRVNTSSGSLSGWSLGTSGFYREREFAENNKDKKITFFIGQGSSTMLSVNSYTANDDGTWPSSGDNTIYISATNGYLYAKGTFVTSSDMRLKDNVSNIDEKYDEFFDLLLPKTFNYKNGVIDNDKNNIHFGFVAQEILNAQNELEIKDTALVADGEYYGLTMQEFISLNTWQIQKAKKRIEILEDTILGLKQQIQTLTTG